MQNGVVSNLGVVLGVSYGIGEPRIALIAGLTAIFAESISVQFLQYSASRSRANSFTTKFSRKKKRIHEIGGLVNIITKDWVVWLETLKNEELRWLPMDNSTPLKDALLVGIVVIIARIIYGLAICLFWFKPNHSTRHIPAAILLFGFGIIQTKITGAHWLRSGMELLLIGVIASIAGHIVGIRL